MILLFVLTSFFAGAADYTRLDPACQSCAQFDKLLQQHSDELSPDGRLKIALKIAKVIQGLRLKTKAPAEQKREIYFAMNASLQVLPDDFDSETAVRLLDLRPQAPAAFDDVLWHFQKGQQERLVERMKAFKDDKVRPGAIIPPVKPLE